MEPISWVLLLLILALQTAGLLVAVRYLVRMGRSVEESTRQLNRLLGELGPRLIEISDGVNGVVRSCRPLGEQLVDISLDIKEVVGHVRETSADVSELIRDTSHSARRQISHIDNIVTDTVKKMESVTNSLTDHILSPLAEVAAVLRGVRAAVGVLRGERPPRSSRRRPSQPDGEDMYI